MEVEKVKKKLKKEQNEIPIFVNTKEQEQTMALSHSTTNPIDSSLKIKLNLSMKPKKKMAAKKPLNHKTKAKKVVSENQTKPSKTKRARFNDLYGNIEAKFSVMERAGRVLEKLSVESPVFVKYMLPSNVAHGFWLIFPKKFCNSYLPNNDTTIILMDECGNEYKTRYLLERHGLSGGWRAFSIAHKLLKGDLLIFHLVGPCKLKVNIVRVYGLDEVDAALCLMNLDVYAKRSGSDLVEKYRVKKWKKAKKGAEPLPSDIPKLRDHNQKNSVRASNSELSLVADQSENDSDGFGYEVYKDSEIANHLQGNELCCRKGSFSHDHLPKGIDCA